MMRNNKKYLRSASDRFGITDDFSHCFLAGTAFAPFLTAAPLIPQVAIPGAQGLCGG